MASALKSYSYSSISLYQQCPCAFKYKYIEGTPEAFTTIEQHLGHCIHETLKDAYKEKTEKNTNISRMLKLYDEHWKSSELNSARVIKHGITASSYYDSGRAMLTSYYDRVLEKDESESVLLEERFNIEVAGKGSRYGYSGVIDRLARKSSGLVVIIDYKTGKSIPNPAEDLQLRSYALYVIDRLAVDSVELKYEDLRGEGSVPATMGMQHVTSVTEAIIRKISEIVQAKSFEASPSILCDWCGFNTMCDNVKGVFQEPGIGEVHLSEKSTENVVLTVAQNLRKGMDVAEHSLAAQNSRTADTVAIAGSCVQEQRANL